VDYSNPVGFEILPTLLRADEVNRVVFCCAAFGGYWHEAAFRCGANV
jgi:hypothetical protein